MYLQGFEIVAEDDITTNIITEITDENIVMEDGIWTKVVNYEKAYSQDEVCEDAKKEVFDMEKNSQGVYKHVDSGGFF